MRRPASRSVRRIAGASRVVRPVTRTCSTCTREESRNQLQPSQPTSASEHERDEAGRAPRRRTGRSSDAASARPCKRGQSASSHGNSASPSSCTSGSSSMPKRSRTRRRPSAIRASTSAVVAAPRVLDEVRVLRARSARRRTASPLQPASSSSCPAVRPSARASSGFLKVEPNVLMPGGLCLAAAGAQVGERGLDRSRVAAASSANEARATTSRGPRFERRYAKPSSSGRAAVDPCGGADVDPLQHAAELPAVGVRVHPHGAADGAGDADAELDARRGRAPPRGRRPAAGGRPRRICRRSPSCSIRGKVVRPASRRVLRTPASATSRFDPEPTTPTSSPSSSAQRSSASSSSRRARANEPGRAPPVRIVVRRASG